jgi:glycosyltransferase involved in cell wall biosynthesis
VCSAAKPLQQSLRPTGLYDAVIVGERNEQRPSLPRPRVPSGRNSAWSASHETDIRCTCYDLAHRFGFRRSIVDDHDLDRNGVALTDKPRETSRKWTGPVTRRNNNSERRVGAFSLLHERDSTSVHVGLITRSLLYGGTERQLVLLARGLEERGHRVSVLQLYDASDFGADLRAAGIDTTSLGLRGRLDMHRLMWRSVRWLRARRPDIVHGFHVESNLLATLLARISPGTRAVWGIRVGSPAAVAKDEAAQLAVRLHTRLLRAPDLVISNSETGARYALDGGAPAERVVVVRNGLDMSLFQRDAEGRVRVRAGWGVAPDETLVGSVARLEPRKGPDVFLRAAAAFSRERPRSRFVWIGDGEGELRRRMKALATGLGIGSQVIWAGWRADVASVHSALDLETLLSLYGEGTPNAVVEAIACGVPCVVSDVGDSPSVVDDARFVVSPSEPKRIATAWRDALEQWTPEAAAAAKRRVESVFAVQRMVYETEAALASLL